jgi:hypothetical protein
VHPLQGTGEFDYAKTPILTRTDGTAFPDFNEAQKSQAQGDLRSAFALYKKAAEGGYVHVHVHAPFHSWTCRDVLE